jgi:Uma2 family endonuclease
MMSAAERARRLLTLEEYHRMADAGVFGPEERLELIEGEIYPMSPQKGPHIVSTRLTQGALEKVFGAGWVVFTQVPLVLPSLSEPEPDVMVVQGDVRDFSQAPPTSAVLVVEVSDTTLWFDRSRKAELYARAAIPEYWIVNLVDRVLEVHRDPDAATGVYRTITHHGESDSVSPLAAPGAAIAVRDLLP